MPKRRVVRHEVIQPQDQSYKLIPLTQGQNAIVDAADFDWLDQWNWTAHWNSHTKSYYADRHIRDESKSFKYKTVAMASEILGCMADHINHDTLDNRRQNIRKADRIQNSRNKRRQRNNTANYIGVHRNGMGWQARIWDGTKVKGLGTFSSREEAARVRDGAARTLRGEFAHLNFPAH